MIKIARRDFNKLMIGTLLAGCSKSSSMDAGAGDGSMNPTDGSVVTPPPGNWDVRANGAGVVWAHRFENKNEITAHLTGATPGGNHAGNAILPFQVPDDVVGHAMRFLALGAILTADFPASGGPGPRPLAIDDSTYWPDPATAGEYFVHLCKSERDQQNNMFRVTAKSGATLTVTYVPSSGQPFQTTQRDWLVGDHIGHQCGVNWSRLFSALKGDSNGLGVDDVNKAGTPLRSTLDQTSFPHGPQAFGYGWYGRPEYQSEFATWRPSDHGVNAIDAVLRSNLWDGTEFYLQWRQKVDPRFLMLNKVAYNGDNRYGRKVWMLQSTMTVPQQITGGYGPGATRFAIPTTPEPPFALAAYSFGGGLAGRTLTSNLDGTGSFQPGGPFAATAQYAVADLPAGAAWEIPSGEWVTFLLHVKPGLRWSADNPSATGVRNTTVEMKAAREHDVDYTTIFSVSDQAIIYGSSGPNEDVWTSALPGYNAISLTGYLNIELGSVVPAASYYVDFSEVIFSTQPIPAPGK